MPRPDVTICIPAWQAEPFIERTLRCAREQTYANIRVLVSVDRCDDRTEAICRAQAALDERIEVIAQPERLGWSENANALLDRVDSEFFCLYFHDDIIEPTYIERLRDALLAHPDAKSAHCDLERFGDEQGVDPGHDYLGSDCRRLLDFMAGPIKGTPLRSLTRSELLAQGLRFPNIGDGGFWRCHPYLFQLLVAGPALRVPEILYRRWFRAGSMTSSWRVASPAPLIEGQQASARLCLQIIDRADASDAEKELLRFGLSIFMMLWTRREEIRLGGDHLIEPATIAPIFEDIRAPAALAMQAPDIQDWIRKTSEGVSKLENRFWTNARNRQGANAP